MKLLVEALNDGHLFEGCVRADEDNVFIFQFVPTRVGYNTKVQVGLHEYGGNMTSREYDHGLVEFFFRDPKLNVDIPVDRGYIKNGEFKCFLRMRPSVVRVHDKIYELEFANAAVSAK